MFCINHAMYFFPLRTSMNYIQDKIILRGICIGNRMGPSKIKD